MPNSNPLNRFITVPLLLLLALLPSSLAGCGSTREPAKLIATAVAGSAPGAAGATEYIRIAAAPHTEARVLRELYAQLLESNGFVVERRGGFTSAREVHEAARQAEIDLYPASAITARLAIPQAAERAVTDDQVQELYQSRYGLTWLEAARFNRSWRLVTRPEQAESQALGRISDLPDLAPRLRLGAPEGFYRRADGLPALEWRYGPVTFAEQKRIIEAPLEPLLDGEVDLVAIFGSRDGIGAQDLVVLEDAHDLWSPRRIAPVVRTSLLKSYPEIGTILNPLASHLTDTAVATLIERVDGPAQATPGAVARRFLVESELLPTASSTD